MELAKLRFDINPGTLDVRQVILYPQDLVAYDVHLVRWVNTAFISFDDPIDVWVMGLSKRQQDLVEDNNVELGVSFRESSAVFAYSTFYGTVRTTGASIGFNADTIPYPKPYRVPFAAAVMASAGSVAATEFILEVYYDEVKVSSREMAWLRRRTERIETS